MIRKPAFWIALCLALFLLSGGLFLLREHSSGGHVARVWLNGELRDTIDLDSVVFPYEFTVESDLGQNTVRVSPGEIAVVSSDCAEQVCVGQGTISSYAVPIVCLPHRLVIDIEEPE